MSALSLTLANVLLTAVMLTARATQAQSQMAQYPVDRYGVSFQFSPSSWSRGLQAEGYIADPVTTPEMPAITALNLNTTYPKTDFGGAQFIYSIRRNSSAEACKDVGSELGGAVSGPEVVHGVTFTHRSTSDAAMMHQRRDELYTVFRNGTCYIFDLALLTSGYGATDGIRRMTDAETKDVERRQMAVLLTIQIQAADSK